MKIGNTSQTNVPVPNFFLNKNLRQLETFQISEGKKYFREKDLFRNTKDINFCNNPRNENRKHENFNKTKFSPDMSGIHNFLKTASNKNSTNRKTFFSKDSHKPNSYSNFRHFMETTNVSNIVNPDLREEIKGNINVLIDKITHNYDLEKWAQTDTRTNFMRNDNHMNSTYNQNTFFDATKTNLNFDGTKTNYFYTTKYDDKNFNQTDANRFKTTLRNKISGMTLEKNYKNKLLSKMDENENSPSANFYKTKSSSVVNAFNEELKTQESQIIKFLSKLLIIAKCIM